MSNPALQTVLKHLPGLKPEEQQEVKKRLDFLLGSKPKNDVSDWLVEGVCAELVRRGLLAGKSAGYSSQLWNKVTPKSYAKDSEAVRVFLTENIFYALTVAETYALGRLVARALADYLQNTPGFGLRMMLQQISKVPEALDASYPGYLAAGMLSRLIR